MGNYWKYSTYSKINSQVEENFPFKHPRKHQLETISEIKEAIDNGYKYIILEAGTGTGKSAIAATLASMFEDTYILTVTKQLQDQYLQDFKDLGFRLVKGRGNFKCRKYVEANLDYTCDEGRCVLEGYRCEYSLNRNHNDITQENTCYYFYQKLVAMNSSVVISNYPYMFLELNNVNDFKNRELMVFDEAHNLEENIMNNLTLEFKRKELRDYGINLSSEDFSKLESGDYTDWIRFIKKVKENYSRELKKIKNIKGAGANEKKSFLKLRIKDCKEFIEHIKQDPYNWIFDYNPRYGIAEFKPIKVDKYAQNKLFQHADVCLFMSATILDYKLFAKWLGINEDEIYAIRRESPFEVDRNPIVTFDEFNMSYGNLHKTAPETIDTINEILEIHSNDKGIIHTVSHQCKNFLMKSIKNKRLIDHKTYNRASQLKKFKNSDKPLVLISPSMNEGVDLPGSQCRFQIIYKIPYPSLMDKQTKERKNMDNQWYEYKTALALVQTYGRGMRYEEDYSKTYFIDSRLKGFVEMDKRRNNFLPDFFIRAIDITPAEIDYIEEVKPEPAELKTELIKDDIEFVSTDLNEINQVDYQDEVKSEFDNLDYLEKVNVKLELYNAGRDLLDKENYKQAIDFYKNLLNHELFINDYHPYLKLSQAYHGAEEYKNEAETVIAFYKSGRYARPSTVKMFKKRLLTLAEIGYFDISQMDELENEYASNGKRNRKFSKIPIPLAKDLASAVKRENRSKNVYDPSIFDDFVNLEDNLSYEEKINFKYKLIKKGDELMSAWQYEKAIAYYNRLLTHELFINDYHPYLKLYKAYGKNKQKEKQVDIIVKFFKSGIYCNKKKLGWFKGRLRQLSNKGLFDPSKIDELENEFYDNGFLNKDLSNKPVPVAIEIKEIVESDKKDKVEYSSNYFNQLSKEIINSPGYKSYTDLTKHNEEDYILFDDYDKINQKAELKNKGKLLEREDEDKAIDFYNGLKENELFKYDYYPYRRQCILFKNYIHDDEKDWQTIVELLSQKIYLNSHQYRWINNKIIELIGKLNLKQNDISKVNILLDDYEINRENYKILQSNYLPIAERIFKDEKGLRVISQEKYDYIESIHYTNELGAGYIRQGEYETAMMFFSKLLKQETLYFKCLSYKSFARIYRDMDDKREFKRLYEQYVN